MPSLPNTNTVPSRAETLAARLIPSNQQWAAVMIRVSLTKDPPHTATPEMPSSSRRRPAYKHKQEKKFNIHKSGVFLSLLLSNNSVRCCILGLRIVLRRLTGNIV